MSLAEMINQFFRNTRQTVFIEVEAKENTVARFINDYNSNYSPQIEIGDDGIVCLSKDKNKWGLELRCYFDNADGFPVGIQVRHNTVYRPEYSFRFNDVNVIKEMFELGYRIGENRVV